MFSSLWISKTGLDAQQTRMDVISNNLANANTTAFKSSRAAFQALPAAAAARGWAHVPQGGGGQVVRCCHTVVDEKSWLFPVAKGARPIEIAFGPLRDGAGAAGCDLRPSHPALAAPGQACCR